MIKGEQITSVKNVPIGGGFFSMFTLAWGMIQFDNLSQMG